MLRRARPRSYRPRLDVLEARTLLSGYQPTDLEQLFLEELNDIRANPAAYGQSIGLDLSVVAPAPPLAFDTRLIQSARDHSQDMSANNYFGHNSLNGEDPGQRMAADGYPWTAWAESIAAGYSSVDVALKELIIDAGVPDLGHRVQLLGIGSPYQSLNQVGVGIVMNGSGSYADYYTIDSGETGDTRAFLTGVVYADRNGNGKYDPGEGLGGVTVTAVGGGSTTTFGSGGYSIPLAPGTYSVIVGGGSFPGSTTETVSIGAVNVRLNINAAAVVPTPPAPLHGPIIATGADVGGVPDVRAFGPRTGAVLRDFDAYDPHFLGGVRVAVGDVNGDGSPDMVTTPGPGGGPDVRVFDGATGALVREFMAFDPAFTGGLNVAVGDVNGDGYADIVVSPDAGGAPVIAVFSGKDGSVLRSFFAFPSAFTGGIRVAAGDVNGDGRADIVTAPGAGGLPDVRVFDGASGNLIREFMAYTPAFVGGVYVAVGDTNGDGRADIITGTGFGGAPVVEVFSGRDNSLLQCFYAYSPTLTAGVRVAATDVNGDGRADIVTTSGPGSSPALMAYDGVGLSLLDNIYAYDPNFLGGVQVGGA